jgi:hypothetical protein
MNAGLLGEENVLKKAFREDLLDFVSCILRTTAPAAYADFRDRIICTFQGYCNAKDTFCYEEDACLSRARE